MGAGSPSSAVPKAVSGPATAPTRPPVPGGWLAAQGRLPLAFMGLGLAWLGAATVLLLVQPTLLGLPHPHPHVVALTHAWVLGFLVTVACGAAYQLVPIALGATLHSERQGWWHFGLHAVGVPGMVYSFWQWDLTLLGHFGAAVGLGVGLFSFNIWRTLAASGRRGTVARSLGLMATWLFLTVAIGLLLAANRFWHFLPLDPVALLRAHAHLGLVGFFLTLLQGVSFQLVPMFTLGEIRDWRLADVGLGLTQVGLLALAPALTWHLEWFAFTGALAIGVGLGCSAVCLWRALQTRKKRRLDPGLVAFLRGGIGLCVAAVVGVVLALPGTPRDAIVAAMAYAVIGILGGLVPCVAGMMCKIVPFLTWMRAYGPRVGRGPTPAAHALAHPQLENWGLGLQQASVVFLLGGVWASSALWLHVGVWIMTAGVGLFLADMLRVLRHLWAQPAVAASMPR